MPINTHHKDFDKWEPIWEKIEDVISGEDEIKRKQQKYLPRLPGQELSKDTGYTSYLSRAVFENFTGRTLDISLGQLFRKPPIISGLDQEYQDNIDLCGQNLSYFSRDIAEDIICFNRAGILVDYSDEQGRPFLSEYDHDDIINWRSIVINGQKKLLFVILEGEIDILDINDPYAEKCQQAWQELYLDMEMGDPIYKTRTWIKNPDPLTVNDIPFIILDGSEKTPKINGNIFDTIPFFFLTSSGFSNEITASALLDLANLNLAHYRNSADYENLLHLTGAGTYILKGWDESKIFPIGGAAALPENGGAEILQGKSDSGLETGMRHKEEIMAMIGSQILSGKGRYVQAAQTAQISSSGEYATLADVSNSLSYCMQIILKLFVRWAGGDDSNVNIQFNTDFDVSEIPPGRLTELMGARQAGAISWKTFFYNLKSYEFYPANWTIENENEEIKKDMAKDVNNRQSKIDSSLIQNMSENKQTPNMMNTSGMPMNQTQNNT